MWFAQHFAIIGALMSLLKQALLVIVVFVLGFWGLVSFVPASLPLLDRVGLLQPFGITVPTGGPAAGAGGPGRRAAGPTKVFAQPVTTGNLFDEITTIGDGRAQNSVTLLPEVAGVLVSLTAQSGIYVEAGSVLATLQSDIQKIELERAQLLIQDAQDTVDRVTALGAAVPAIQRSTATLALRSAELDLQEARFEVARRQITAPISGWVGIISLTVGDQVTTATEITEIDDRSKILVEFRVPERFVGQIALGDTVQATPLARPQSQLIGTVSAVDNRVDPASRTLRLQAALDNDDDLLRAGMAFRITMSFTGEPFPSVAPLAIQWGSDGPFVWVVADGKAARQKITIMQRNSDAVLVAGDLPPGTQVVTEGVQNLRLGAEVEVQAPPTDAAAPQDQVETTQPTTRG
jgi:RND family efflux transporter MFP subunit